MIEGNPAVNGFTIHIDQSVHSGGEGSAPEFFTLFFLQLVPLQESLKIDE